MTTERSHIHVSDVKVEIVRKDIKNLHVGVYPPDGRVRVAAPLRLDDEAVRLAIVSRLAWIHKRQDALRQQPRQSQREMVTGESHYVFGHRYRLEVLEDAGPASVEVTSGSRLRLSAKPGANAEKRRQILNAWYRRLLRKRIPELLAEWQPIVGVEAADWGIKRMKTKWGSCNPDARRIWLNLELAKKPPECLEYVLVHELVHLRERRHGRRFVEIMDSVMPSWRLHRDELYRAPLAHETWDY